MAAFVTRVSALRSGDTLQGAAGVAVTAVTETETANAVLVVAAFAQTVDANVATETETAQAVIVVSGVFTGWGIPI
jgi:hypothetical protein